MSLSRCLVILVALCALCVVTASAQTPPLLHDSFDEARGGWIGLGTNARATVTQQGSFNGRGALKYEYDAVKGSFSGLLTPVTEGALAAAKSFRLWVRSDYPTTLALLLQEKGGARYLAPIAAPKDRWQEAHANIADFGMLEGPDNPADTDRQLTLSEVTHIGLIDVGVMLAAMGGPEAEKLLSFTPGPHTLLVDDFTVLDRALATPAPAPGTVWIDAFSRPHVGWLVLGAAALTRSAPAADQPAAMVVQYDQAPGKAVFIARMVQRGSLKDLRSVHLTLQSNHATTLLVRLEEAPGGGKYQAVVTVPEGGEVQDISLPIAEFTAADDSPVKDRPLKPELVTTVALADASGMMGAVPEARTNTLRVSRLRVSTK